MTDDDALPSSVERIFERSGDLTLCGLLALPGWRQSKCELQRLSQGIGDYLKCCRTMSHHWPFLGYSIGHIATDQAAQACLGFSRKGPGQDHNRPQCASLAIDD